MKYVFSAASNHSFLGKAQLYVTVNRGPRDVACQVQPRQGLEAHTTFGVFCTSGAQVRWPCSWPRPVLARRTPTRCTCRPAAPPSSRRMRPQATTLPGLTEGPALRPSAPPASPLPSPVCCVPSGEQRAASCPRPRGGPRDPCICDCREVPGQEGTRPLGTEAAPQALGSRGGGGGGSPAACIGGGQRAALPGWNSSC